MERGLHRDSSKIVEKDDWMQLKSRTVSRFSVHFPQFPFSDSDLRPVRLVHLLLYEAAQFLDDFGKMSQTSLYIRCFNNPLGELVGN